MEVTTYRVDVGYSDARHPDEVKFAAKLEDDLARRDFTVNAIAAEPAPTPGESRMRGTLAGEVARLKCVNPFAPLTPAFAGQAK